MQAYQLRDRINTSGAALNGGLAYFYLTGTTTLAVVYEDAGLNTPLSNPVVADSAGFFPELCYLDPEVTYRLVIKTSAGVTISKYSADPINTPAASGDIDGADIAENSIPATAFEPTAVEDALGFTPQEDLTALTPTAKNALLDRIGEIFYTARTSAPAGSLKCNGATIGSATSGATNAHADYAALFALLWAWNASDSAILDSAGAGTTRGANAAADFAADKRLTLPDLRGEFIRGLDDSRSVDTGRRIGQTQTEMVGPHQHDIGGAVTYSNGGQPAIDPTGNGILSDGSTGTENRPRNVALLACIRY